MLSQLKGETVKIFFIEWILLARYDPKKAPDRSMMFHCTSGTEYAKLARMIVLRHLRCIFKVLSR